MTPENNCILVAKPNPLAGESFYTEVAAGQTLLEMVGHGVSETCSISIGGENVPRQLWAHVKPKAGQMIHVVMYPQGGGGSAKWIRGILLVAVAIFSYGAASGAAWAGGLAGDTAAATGLAVGIGGNLLINALVPVPTAKAATTQSFDTLNSLTGTSNQAAPYGVIPFILGTMTYYPPHAALPYTEISGDEQYLRMLLDLGYAGPGGMDISNIQIGGSDIDTFDDVEWEVDTNPTLYSNDIYELAVGATLDPSSTTIRTTQDDTDEVSIDIIFPSGLFAVTSKGKVVSADFPVVIEYAVNGTDHWYGFITPTPTYTVSYSACTLNTTTGVFDISSAAEKTLRVGIRWKLPWKAAWDIKIIAGTPGWDKSVQQVTTMQWSVLRSIHSSLPSTTGTNKLAVRIKATDQLNGIVSNLSVTEGQLIRTGKSDGTWNDPALCQNPSWLTFWLMTQCPGVQKRFADARLDMAAFYDWASECTSRGYLASASVDSAGTFFDLLDDVLAAGRATLGMRNGKYAPIRDIKQTVPVQMFTPSNSWGFQYTRTFTTPPDALKVTFTNVQAANQQDVVVVYRPGITAATAVTFDQIDLPKCIDPSAAWKLGYYHLLCAWHRPTTYTFSADIEHIVCERGDLVMVAHDIIQYGLASGRIKAVNGNNIVLDGPFEFEPTKSYAIRVRHFDNAQTQISGSPQYTWDTTYITLDNDSDIDDINAPTCVVAIGSTDGVAAGDLFVIGEVANIVTPMIVTAVKPGTDMSAQLTCVDEAPEVYAADTATPPAWTSQITNQPWNKKPAVPAVEVRIGGSNPDAVGVIHTSGGVSSSSTSGTAAVKIGGANPKLLTVES